MVVVFIISAGDTIATPLLPSTLVLLPYPRRPAVHVTAPHLEPHPERSWLPQPQLRMRKVRAAEVTSGCTWQQGFNILSSIFSPKTSILKMVA